MENITWTRCTDSLPAGDHNTSVICCSNNNRSWTTSAAALRAVSETHEEWAFKSQFIVWVYDTPEARDALKGIEIF